MAWFRRWGALVTIIFATEDSNGASSASAMSRRVITYYYPVTELYERAASGGCLPGVPPKISETSSSSPLIKSDLKLTEWLESLLLSSVTGEIESRYGRSVISHEVKFQSASSGGLSTELRPADTNSTATHVLLITFGPIDPSQRNGGLAAAATSSHLASQMGAALSNGLKGHTEVGTGR
jgi:hypothetical protein